ncbi:hypothetical protein HU200_052332 [Digitaria exilis]|uniref:protein-serine/threonine phosphatase n=1 Tax=Digitaria exilis TaxID=1010633 RepID=A0A835AQ02_9POAL|nr:hypothetical protein HU200_052332 [Digitaria exilis]
MASAGFNMPGGGDAAASSSSSAAQECRLRRRRRLAPPPHRADAGAGGEKEKRVRPSTPSSSSEEEAEVDDDDQEQPGRVAFGWVSVAGRSREMEDAVSLRPAFCTNWLDGSPIHFFGVFDGHGGSHVRTTPSIFYVSPAGRSATVSTLCRDRMHEFLAEELATEAAAFRERRKQQQQPAAAEQEDAGTTTTTTSATSQGQQQVADDEQDEERAWRAALSRAFDRVDALASVAVRACMSYMQPDRADELARIEAAGGRVLYINGHRVRGILAMSRALGDRMLRPEVIAEPEITVTRRTPEDECLILASDGMWDVISNDVACSVARQCLQDGGGNVDDVAAAAEARCSRAASLLVRLALGRATWDNVSVIVVDLKHRGGS